jgi:hypothetical protein
MQFRLFRRQSSGSISESARSGSPASSTDSEVADSRVADLWIKLEALKHTRDWASNNNKEVAVNISGVGCSKKHGVTATSEDGTITHIHANKIGIPEESNSTAPHYLAGQSPESGSLDAILAQGIESGLGIYQFVSRNAHKNEGESSKKTILAMLNERIERGEKPENGEELKIAGKYKIISLKDREIVYDPYSQYDLKVEVIDSEPRREISIPITQAGYPFRGAVLQAEDIAHAHGALNKHIRSYLIPTPTAQSETGQIHPLILSHAGIGRNATLITYDRIINLINHKTPAERITTAADLDNKLLELITEGRKARGPQFIHSREQLAALRKALIKEIEGWKGEQDKQTKDNVRFQQAGTRHLWFNRLFSGIPLKQLLTSTKEKTGK